MAHSEVYRWSSSEARRGGEMDLWQESYAENCRCARAIEEAIHQNFDGRTLNTGCVKDIISEFGYDRTNWVLANTVRQKTDDGRFSPGNRAWANGFRIPREESARQFVVDSHPAVVDGFIMSARKQWQDLNLFDSSHCLSEKHGGIDYTGRVLVLSPSILKDSMKAPENQLFLATSGFGCSPTASGRKVFGRFLVDDEETYFYRSDFIGAIKNDHLPQWAWDKVMPPIRSVVAVPGMEAQETIASTHWDGIRQIIGCDRPTCDGLEWNEGLVNVYYDQDAKANGKPFNRRIGDREYYGTVLINGMHSFDQPLSPIEAQTLITLLNDELVMSEVPEQTNPIAVQSFDYEVIPSQMPELILDPPEQTDPDYTDEPIPVQGMVQPEWS